MFPRADIEAARCLWAFNAAAFLTFSMWFARSRCDTWRHLRRYVDQMLQTAAVYGGVIYYYGSYMCCDRRPLAT